MRKTAFLGFGEVNTPIDIIVRKCQKAEADLKAKGLELISVYPITDDYEEKDIKTAKRFGCKSVFIDRTGRNVDFGQDYTVIDLNGLWETLV